MAPLTLTILGAGPAAPNRDGACSGYLVQQNGTAVLMDCGSGIAGRLVAHLPPNRLHGVAVSHFHPDHYFDLVPLYYLLKFGEPRPAGYSRLVPLHVPPGGRAFLREWGQLISDKPAMLEDVFEVCEYKPGHEIPIGELNFTFHAVQHYVPSHAMRVRGGAGEMLVFSSDVAPCQQLIDAARDADLFMCESALLDPSQDEADPRKRGHMSAQEAGVIAHQAGARRLMLTHYRSTDTLDLHHRQAAERTFGHPVELAREGESYVIA